MELIRGVRPMTGQDIEQVADLEQVCFSESWSENLIRMGLDSRLDTYFVYADHGAILGSGLYNVVIAVAVFNIPKFARLVRGNTLETKNSVFVQAARNIGAGDMRILLKHILPSAIPNIIVQYTMSIGTSIITASSLSFLGMGAQPPTPEWGLLLSNGRNYMLTSWHITLFPGLAIFFTVLCFNLLGDGLRDALDPKLTD